MVFLLVSQPKRGSPKNDRPFWGATHEVHSDAGADSSKALPMGAGATVAIDFMPQCAV